MKKFSSGWYLLYTMPCHEKKIFSRLNDNKIKSFLPLVTRVRMWHDRKKVISEPIFPSYVFIYLNDLKAYYAGMEVKGVLSYVKVGNTIARVHESVIESLQLITEHKVDLEVSYNHFPPGSKFVISKGALTGLSCEVVEVNNKQKLLVRVELIQRNLLLTLPADFLVAV